VRGLDEVAYVSEVPIVADIFGCSNCQALVDSSDGTVTGREGLRDCDLRGSLTIISCGINSPNDPGVSTRIVSGGGLLPMKGIKIDLEPREGTATIHHESTVIRPFGRPDWRMFTPERVAIETTTGIVVQERTDPRSSFAGHTLNSPWDLLHRAYFNGYGVGLISILHF